MPLGSSGRREEETALKATGGGKRGRTGRRGDEERIPTNASEGVVENGGKGS